MIHLHNSMTRRKQPLETIEPNHVRMYVCGMTVYDYCHIGHARVLVVFDVLYRYLQFRGYKVTYVRNITDVDDKIIQRANENGEEMGALTQRFIDAMHEDAAELGVLSPTHEPRATEHMQEILDMTTCLMDKDYAYAADNGDVYYRVRKFDGYGKLSGKSIDDLISGARVAKDEAKDDPLDFALWKAVKPEEPAWDSPWGRGRPGWHIECSAMSTHALGNHFDIHGGGQDLLFPHHENEIAQSEACTGETFANLWVHNGYVQIDNEKMSKSLGNFFTVREVLEHYKGEELRYFVMSSHYRSPLNYSDKALDQARAALEGYYLALNGVEIDDSLEPLSEYVERFTEVMDDDINTAEALAVLADIRKELNRARDAGDDAGVSQLAATLKHLGGVLGLLQQDPQAYLKGDSGDDAEIEALIAQRDVARAEKNWAESDRIREQLTEMGVIIEDSAGGTSWRRG